MRRSAVRPTEVSTHRQFRSPYRCRDCGQRFWAFNKHAYFLASMVVVVIVAGATAWSVGDGSEDSRSEPKPVVTPSAVNFVETLRLAQGHDPVAEYNLAHIYAEGNGVVENRQEARLWLERSAEDGNTDAQYELGNALREGMGMIQDYETAAKWLQLAAASGNGDAQYALGLMYRAGLGVAPNNPEAYMWFNLAAAHGVVGALAQRDTVLRTLTPEQVLQAQAEARRLNEVPSKHSALAP